MSFGDVSFPNFGPLRAKCALSVNFYGKGCSDVYQTIRSTVESYNPEPSNPGPGGTYALIGAIDGQTVRATRTTPVKKFVDDIIFEAQSPEQSNGDGCTIKARSRSQTPSVKDFGTNFCNMWNVLKAVEGEDFAYTVDTSVCAGFNTPDDPKTNCEKY